MLKRLFGRPTGEIMVLLIAVTICTTILGVGTSTMIFLFLNPNLDVTNAARFISTVTNTLIGLLAGYLAGRTERASQEADRLAAAKRALEAKPEGEPDEPA